LGFDLEATSACAICRRDARGGKRIALLPLDAHQMIGGFIDEVERAGDDVAFGIDDDAGGRPERLRKTCPLGPATTMSAPPRVSICTTDGPALRAASLVIFSINSFNLPKRPAPFAAGRHRQDCQEGYTSQHEWIPLCAAAALALADTGDCRRLFMAKR